MKKLMQKASLGVSAALFAGLMNGVEAYAQNDFGDISQNITESIDAVPGMLTGLSYMLGILLGVLGILKIKDHVENPSQAQLSHGAVRLGAGGALFALPIVYEAMRTTIGETDTDVSAASLNRVEFNVE